MENKKELLGQYFTKKEIVEKIINLFKKYKILSKEIKILEPSAGSRNFITVLNELGFSNIDECEIDSEFTNNPQDFFEYDINKKYDLIIGNPPFSKYNLKDSYYDINKYKLNEYIPNSIYLNNKLLKKNKERIENIFILKSLKHLKDENSSIGFVLPISFWIGNKNKDIKNLIIKKFNNIIIFQNDEKWFDYDIPCCFTIMINLKNSNKIVLIYENIIEELNLEKINEELIPKVYFNKKSCLNRNSNGIELSNYLINKRLNVKKSFKNNNISAKNILDKNKILDKNRSYDYKLAVTRVGNSSVGKSGLIDIKNDILNDMFYVLDFKDKYENNYKLKEEICKILNENQKYFQNSTIRVGSKSIKKEDILNFKIDSKRISNLL